MQQTASLSPVESANRENVTYMNINARPLLHVSRYNSDERGSISLKPQKGLIATRMIILSSG